MLLQRKDGIDIITGNYHVIHIKQKQSDAARRPASKESIVGRTLYETESKDCIAKPLKPGPWCLFEPIYSTTKPTYLLRRVRKARRWSYVNLLRQVTMQEDIRDI